MPMFELSKFEHWAILSLFLIFDIFMTLNTGFYDKGELVKHRVKIFK